MLKFIGLDNIEHLQVFNKDDKLVVDWIDRDSILDSAKNEMNHLINKTEKAILSSAKDNFSRSYLVKNSLNPIIKILRLLFVKEGFSKDLIESKNRKYLRFLNNLNFININENRISVGKEIDKYYLYDKEIEETEKLHSILGEIIEHGHSFLKTEMKINHIDPFLRITNANFFPSSLKNEKLHFEPKDFESSMKNLYGKSKRTSDIQNYLKELELVNVFDVEDGYYSPSETVWNSYKNKIKNVGVSF